MSLATTLVNEECVQCVVLDDVIFKKEKIDASEAGHLLEFEVPMQTFEYEVTEVEIEGIKTGFCFDGEKCREQAVRYTKVSQDTELDPYCVGSEVTTLADFSANMTESIQVFNRVLSSVTKDKASTKKSTRRAPGVTMDTIGTRRDQKIREITAAILSNTYTIKGRYRCRICLAQSVAFQLCNACEKEKARQQLVNISVKERIKEYKSRMRALEEKETNYTNKALTKKSTRRAPRVTMDTIGTRRDQKIKLITAAILSNTYTIKGRYRCRICLAQSVAFQLCNACEKEKARQQLVNISVKERIKEYKSRMRALEEKETNYTKNLYDIRECWVRLERCNATDIVARLHANNCHNNKPYHCETCKRKLDSAHQCQTCERNISIRECSVRLERCDRTKKSLKTQRKTIKCRSCKTEIGCKYKFCKPCERQTAKLLVTTVSKQKCVTGIQTKTNGSWTCYSYCNKCNRKFINAQELVDHKRRKHRVPYSCEICKSVFSTLGCLQEHVGVHTAPG